MSTVRLLTTIDDATISIAEAVERLRSASRLDAPRVLATMLDHLDAWDRKDIDKAREIWLGGLSQLHSYVADMGRLHIRYKTATWLCGLIPSPFMRAPMPKPQQHEIDTLYRLLKNVGLPVIDIKETRLAA